jgi:hypothetical protein
MRCSGTLHADHAHLPLSCHHSECSTPGSSITPVVTCIRTPINSESSTTPPPSSSSARFSTSATLSETCRARRQPAEARVLALCCRAMSLRLTRRAAGAQAVHNYFLEICNELSKAATAEMQSAQKARRARHAFMLQMPALPTPNSVTGHGEL